MSEIPAASYAQIENSTLSPAPPGVVADIGSREWHGQGVVIAASVGIPLMLIMASIRVYAKAYLIRKWASDDWIFLVSLSSALSLISLQIGLVTGGAYGYHAWDVQIRDLTTPVLLRSLTLQVAAGPLTWLIKLALFSLIYNTFKPLTYVRRLVWGGLIVSGLYYIASAVVNGVICGPRGGHDQLSYLAGLASPRCGDPSGIIQIFSILTGVVNLVVDIYLLIIPLRAISNLRLPLKRKVGVFFIFMTGIGQVSPLLNKHAYSFLTSFSACVMSILTLYYRSRGFSAADKTSWKHDTTYQNISLLTVSTIEYTVGIIIPCMAPSAKAFNQASSSVSSYFNSRVTGLKRVESSDGTAKPTELKIFQQRELEQHVEPVSQADTIDRMLTQLPPWAGKTQQEVYN